MIFVILYSMKKAITTHIDISHSMRQNQNRVFFSWKQLWAKINKWCLNLVKNTCKYIFCSFWESAAYHNISLDLWTQLKSAMYMWCSGWGGCVGQLNVLLVLCCTRMPLVLAQTASSSECSVHQLNINCGIKELLWPPSTFILTYVVSSVMSLEGRLDLELCQLYLFCKSSFSIKLNILSGELLGVSGPAESSPQHQRIYSNIFRLEILHRQLQYLCIKFITQPMWSVDLEVTLLRSVYILTLHHVPCDSLFVYNSFQNIICVHYLSPSQMSRLDTRWVVVNFKVMLWNVLGKIPEEHF